MRRYWADDGSERPTSGASSSVGHDEPLALFRPRRGRCEALPGRGYLLAVGLELAQSDEFALGTANLDVPRPPAHWREDPRRPLREARGFTIELSEADLIFGNFESERQTFVETAVRPI